MIEELALTVATKTTKNQEKVLKMIFVLTQQGMKYLSENLDELF